MSSSDEGVRPINVGHPHVDEQSFPRVFRVGGASPPADVLALVDHKGGYWPRSGVDCWICPGGEPHTWEQMAPAGPFVEAPQLPDATKVAAAIAADDTRRLRR